MNRSIPSPMNRSQLPRAVVANTRPNGVMPLNLGVRAHDFGRQPVQSLATSIASSGFGCVQLALNKAIAGLNLTPGDLTPELARDLGQAFRWQGVKIAVLGCYINPLHPDTKTRARLLQFFGDHLRVARDFGCPLVALESGSLNADYSPHPANHDEPAFQTLLTSLEPLVVLAEELDVCVGLEAVTTHTVSSANKMRRVLDTLRSRHLKVVLDPVNLLNAGNVSQQQRIVTEAFDLLGPDVAVLHAKDFIPDREGLRTVPAGSGQLDYAPVLRWVRSVRPGIPILLEEADASVAPARAQYLNQKFKESNL